MIRYKPEKLMWARLMSPVRISQAPSRSVPRPFFIVGSFVRAAV
jgi:hypothetical protein